MPPKSRSPATPLSVDQYLATLPGEKRVALEKLRRAIHAAAPKAEECISYGIPGFRLSGKYLVGFGATARHCAFYLGSTVQRQADKLEDYDTRKGTIRFQPSSPLPASLVRHLMKARIAEKRQNEEET